MSRSLLPLFFSLLISFAAFAQVDSTVAKQRDSIAVGIKTKDSAYHALLQNIALKANQKMRERYQEQMATTRQGQLFSNLRAVYQRTRDYLKRGVDTSRIEDQLNDTETKIELAGEGIFINQGTIQTARNIATSGILLRELADRNDATRTVIHKYMLELEEFRGTIDSLASDSLLFFFPSDTTEINASIKRLANLQTDIRPIDSMLNISIRKIRSLESRAGILGGNIESRLEDIESFHNSISDNSLGKEVSYFWETAPRSRPLAEILGFSLRKTQMVFLFYLRNHSGKLFLLLVAFLMLSYYLHSLGRNIRDVMGDGNELNKHLTVSHPFLCSLLIVITLGQFIFPDPPFAFYAMMWTIATLALMFSLWERMDPYWRRLWIFSFLLFLLANLFNLILQASRTERYLMLAFSVLSIGGGWEFMRSRRRESLHDKRVIIFVWLFLLMEAGALVANIGGRYNLAKSLLTSGHFNLVVGLQLLWTISFLHEIFVLSGEAYREGNKSRFYVDFNKLSREFPNYLYFLLGLGWFMLVGRNFFVYRQITDPVIDFFIRERSVGEFSFSFSSILLFIFIISLSALLAKFVSFFVDNGSGAATGRRGGLGNWMLLIRIAIISVGTFLAFAATGIPLDRVAIVFGALSVGIGFGMQNLVNNLISGLIIAFEKPMNVGDIVQIGAQTGTMKAIGFRSSVISTFEGSDVVIPNGELLNQHLINWTLNSTDRRMEILVGVNYQTDLEKAIQLIKGLMQADARIHHNPEPQVLLREFSNSSIELRVLFWVDNRDNWPLVRSDLMRSIKKAFEENSIEIPYPQMVLHQSQPENSAPKEEQKHEE